MWHSMRLFFFIPCGNFQAHSEQKIINICVCVFLVFDMFVYTTSTIYFPHSQSWLCELNLLLSLCAPLNKSHADNWLEFAIPSTQDPSRRNERARERSRSFQIYHMRVSLLSHNAGTQCECSTAYGFGSVGPILRGTDISCHEMIVSSYYSNLLTM